MVVQLCRMPFQSASFRYRSLANKAVSRHHQQQKAHRSDVIATNFPQFLAGRIDPNCATTTIHQMHKTLRNHRYQHSSFPKRASFQNYLRSFSSKATTSSTSPLSLHYERILPTKQQQQADNADADADEIISGSKNNPIIFLHGLLGNGRNLKTFAKQVCQTQQKPGYLLDLRGHGRSRLIPDDSSHQIHSFAACVNDLRHTIQSQIVNSVETGTKTWASTTLVGHSWGGRMALQYAYEQVMMHPNAGGGGGGVNLDRVWLLDTVPGQANESVERVVGIVTRLQQEHGHASSKKELVERLTQQEGLDMATSQWLASSYQQSSSSDGGGGSGPADFGFDLSVVQGILPEFGSQDFEGMLKTLLQQNIPIELVRGGKNQAWDDDIGLLNRLDTMQKEHPKYFRIHVLPKAGHWVHVDDMKGLVSLLAKHNQS